MSEYTLRVKLTGESNELEKAVDTAKKSVLKLKAEVKDYGKKSQDSSALTSVAFTQVGQTMSSVGGKILGSYKNMVTGALDFESSTRRASVLTGGSYEEIKNAALSMAKSSIYTTTDVANAMANLGQKGFDSAKAIQAMPGILSAAAASGEDLGLVTDTVTSALNTFNLKASASGHVADVLASAANSSAAGVSDMGYAFKYAAPIANTLGFSIEDLAASTAILSDVGIKGEQAGTALRAGFTRLSAPTAEAKKQLDAMGISLVGVDGNMKPLSSIVGEFTRATEGMGGAQKTAALSAVFGAEAQAAWGKIIEAGPEKLDTLTATLQTSSGESKKSADSMNDGWGGSMKKMGSAIDVLQKKVADAVSPITGYVADMISNIISWFDSLPAPMQKIIGVIGGLIGGIVAIGGAIIGFAAVKGVLDSLGLGAKFMDIGSKIGTAMTSISLPMLAVIAVIALIAFAIIDLWNNSESFRNAVMDIWDSVSSTISSAWENLIKPVFEAIAEVIGYIIEDVIKPLYEKVKGAVEIIVVAVASMLKKLQPIFDIIIKILGAILPPIIKTLGKVFSTVFGVISRVVGGAFEVVGGIIKGIAKVFGGLIDFITGVFTGNWRKAWEGIKSIFSGIWDGLVAVIKAPINFIINIINFFIKGLNHLKVPDWVPLIGGKGINISLIPNLLHGTDNWQGGFARMNEGGRGELTYLPSGSVVVPHDISRVYAKESARLHNNAPRELGVGGTVINVNLSDITINDTRDIKVIAKELATYTAKEVRYG